MKLAASTLLLSSMVGMTTGQMVDSNLAGVLASNGNFPTLIAALGATGLVPALEGEGPFTVFAPTGTAFAALPAGLVDCLLMPDNLPTLSAILQYHVVAGQFLDSTVLTSGAMLPSLQGESLTVTITESGVSVQNAQVVMPDMYATNGVAHGIDAVMVPPSVDVAAFMATSCMAMGEPATPISEPIPPTEEFVPPMQESVPGTDIVPTMAPAMAPIMAPIGNTAVPPPLENTATGGNIVALAAQNPNFSTVVGLITQLGLDSVLSGPGPFTVFAPTDAAFAQVDTTGLTNDDLSNILLFHVVSGRTLDRATMVTGSLLMANGKSNYAVVTGAGTFVDNSIVFSPSGARINGPAVTATNGVIYPISRVMLPPAPQPTFPPAAFAGITDGSGSSSGGGGKSKSKSKKGKRRRN